MALVVQKYGGSSVADAAGIKRVAKRISDTKNAGNSVVVVVSAMGDTTDELLDLAHQVTPQPAPRELDMLLTSGERISMSLLAMTLKTMGYDARSYTGSQAGMETDENHGKAKIVVVQPHRIQRALDEGAIAIVAGFQGFNRNTGDITTLGRGGSDTTAVALASALKADVCEIYSDVDGVYTADPRLVPKAKKIDVISSDVMLEMAASGAKILNIRAVEFARRHSVVLNSRSSFSADEGTFVVEDVKKATGMEEPIISGIATDTSEAKVTVIGIPDIPGKAAQIFNVVATTNANIDMIVQNVSAAATGLTDISFTLPMDDGSRVIEALTNAQHELGFESIRYDDQIAKLALIGAGMRVNSGVSAKLFTALSEAGVNIEMISTSEIRISVVTRADQLQQAAQAVHSAFDLDSEEDATVYGGTGR